MTNSPKVVRRGRPPKAVNDNIPRVLQNDFSLNSTQISAGLSTNSSISITSIRSTSQNPTTSIRSANQNPTTSPGTSQDNVVVTNQSEAEATAAAITIEPQNMFEDFDTEDEIVEEKEKALPVWGFFQEITLQNYRCIYTGECTFVSLTLHLDIF